MYRFICLSIMAFSYAFLQAEDPPKPAPALQKSEKAEEDRGKSADDEGNEEELILTPSKNWKDKVPSYYRVPKSATKGVKGIGYPYTIWYDHYDWEESPPLNDYAEKSFRIEDKNIYAIIVTDEHRISLEELDDIVIKNARENGFEQAKIISIEKRKINSNDIVFMHWSAILQGISVDFLSYLYSDSKGSVFLHTYTPSELFKGNNKKMETFLNGFTIEEKSVDVSRGKKK